MTIGYRTRAIFALAVWSLGIAACGGGGQAERYYEVDGRDVIEFRRDGTWLFTLMGTTGTGSYRIDGDRYTLESPNGTLVLTRDGDLLRGGPFGETYVRAGGRILLGRWRADPDIPDYPMSFLLDVRSDHTVHVKRMLAEERRDVLDDESWSYQAEDGRLILRPPSGAGDVVLSRHGDVLQGDLTGHFGVGPGEGQMTFHRY